MTELLLPPTTNYGLPVSSESTKNVAAAISRAQGDMAPAVADCMNNAFRNGKKYADINAVTQACLPSLVKNKLSLTGSMHFFPSETSATGFVHILEMRITHGDGEASEFISSYFPFAPTKNDAHAIGSWLTYARRYCLSALLCIVVDQDDDGNGAGGDNGGRANDGEPGFKGAQLGTKAAALLDGIKRATTQAGVKSFQAALESGNFSAAEMQQLQAALNAQRARLTPGRNGTRGAVEEAINA